MTPQRTLLAAAAALVLATTASAEISIGVSMPLTGPGSGAGIPMNNMIKLWPKEIGGEALKVTVYDDATDPTKGTQNVRRLITEGKIDLLVSSVATPVAVAIVDVTNESETPTLAGSPIDLPPGKDAWTFRLPQSSAVMAQPIMKHMLKHGIKTVGFLGYADAYGEVWLKDFTALAEKNGIKLIATERFARSDTSVAAQALKITSARPDAILIVASGSGAAMPHKGIVERGFKGKIYQTHAAASPDLIRLGGKDVEGALVASGPAVVPELLPASNASKAAATDYVGKFEKAYGPNTRSIFAANMYDAQTVLEKVIPVALKKAKPGTKEFRHALKDAIENMGPTVFAQGVMHWTKDNHWGYTPDSGILLKVANGAWTYEE